MYFVENLKTPKKFIKKSGFQIKYRSNFAFCVLKLYNGC